MTRTQKLVLWTTAVCLCCLLAGKGLTLRPPSGTVLAQEPATKAKPDGGSAPASSRPAPPTPATTLEPRVAGITVSYPFPTAEVQVGGRKLKNQFAGKANVHFDPHSKSLVVTAPADVHAEIRAIVNFLTKQYADKRPGAEAQPPMPDAGGMTVPGMATPPQATQYGYLALAQRQQLAAQEQVRAARQALFEAKTVDEKTATRAQLKKLLAEIFAYDMQIREKQAAEIEARLSKLRQQYRDREAAKDKIIDLQLKVIEADAAGLGFPGVQPSSAVPSSVVPSSVVPPSPTNPGGGSSIRSGKQAGSQTPATFWMGSEAYNLPASVNVLSLSEFKKTHPTVVANLKTAGHFIESEDGKLYAYANVNYPSGPSVIHVVDSAAGNLVATGTMNSVARPLVFTEEGVATREAFNVPHVRVRLKKRGDVYEPINEQPDKGGLSPRFNGEGAIPGTSFSGDANRSPFDPMTAALDPELLKSYSPKPQERVGALSARGHFVGSPDGKLYAYVETSGQGIPDRTAEIRVCDVKTGQRLAAAKLKGPVGKLRFFHQGVATEDADGTLKLRISFSKDHETQDVLETALPKGARDRDAADQGGSLPSAAVHAQITNPPPDDPVTLSETVRRESVAMLQGTWNCVAARSSDKELSKDELAALALQVTIKQDIVTMSYFGDDLQQHQTAGKLLIDMSSSPPSFNIDIHVAGFQAQSRLSGQTRLDRGVLRMNRPGGAFLIRRKTASEPSVFEFKRPPSDSANGDSGSELDRNETDKPKNVKPNVR